MLENWLADCWQAVFYVSRPERDAPAPRTDAVTAARLCETVLQRFGFRIPDDWPVCAPTIRTQANVAQRDLSRPPPASIVLRRDGRGPVCILIPGVGGHAWAFESLAASLTQPCDVVAVNLATIPLPGRGQGGRHIVRTGLEHASRFAKGRPVILGGYSVGGLAAHAESSYARELCGRLERLVLIDPWPLDVTPMRMRLRMLSRSFNRWLRPRQRAAPAQSPTARLLERDVRAGTIMLLREYLGARNDQGVPMGVALSHKAHLRVVETGELLGRAIDSVDAGVLPGGHLDLVRPETSAATARWFDEQIRRAA